MSQVNGQLTTCDRCGTQTFRKCTGEGETDGGFTRWNNFEPYPEGWDIVTIPVDPSGLQKKEYIRTCPKCSELWRTILNENYLRETPYYYVEEAET